MKRIKKAFLLLTRKMAYRWRALRLYYWADEKLYPLRFDSVMPAFYYLYMFKVSMWLVRFRRFQRLADRTIHMVPLHIRFNDGRISGMSANRAASPWR